MSTIHWRKVVKLATKEFACFLMSTDDKARTLTLEAMLGCRNPDDEPEDRVYYGWHALYSMPEQSLLQTELFIGSCCQLGQWNCDDLADSEVKIIQAHMEELLADWHEKLVQAQIECDFQPTIASAANE